MPSDKITRTIRLNSDINDRLIALCDHIGTNPNAYLISEIGKAISRDEVAFLAQQRQADFLSNIVEVMAEAAAQKDAEG